MRLTGAEIIVRSLMREGVETVFGHPGGAVLPLYDALYGSPLRHVLCRHEQGAVHAADGYARASGRVGVCVATSGPGATNLITGLATAHMDSIGIVALTGQVGQAMLGTDAFQEADIVGMTLPVVKHSYLVKRTEDIPRVMREAFHIASTGRPGPVLVDLPKDVQTAEATVRWPEGRPHIRGYRPFPEPDPAAVAAAADLIEEASRPLIMAGGGVVKAGAAAELRALAERLGAPVISTLMGLGAFPGGHPLHLGMMGMHGTPLANVATMQCDLLIGAGVRFDDRVTSAVAHFAPQARVVHLDVDPAEIGKNVAVSAAVVGDCRRGLALLLAATAGRDLHRPWAPQLPDSLHPGGGRLHGYPEEDLPDGHISGPEAVRALYRAAGGGDPILVTDVGQHQMWAAQHFVFDRPGRFITSGGLGTMGFGLPAAVGAALACAGRRVICLTGDGSLQMTVQELGTVASNRLPVTIALFDNGFLGLVRQQQQMLYRRRYSSSELANPDFVRLAEAYGIPGVRAGAPDEMDGALAWALRTDGPSLIDICMSPVENTLPFVPPGRPLADMILRAE